MDSMMIHSKGMQFNEDAFAERVAKSQRAWMDEMNEINYKTNKKIDETNKYLEQIAKSLSGNKSQDIRRN